ncbi:hypothetical protein [Treponema zioleckii]|uniref:hypothetical protein n=1 Tax=Treponema zioleckii TaxID=331680 RepID=UPI00168B5221|nr:hypothetical protein [Treponema zioleckii]
MNTIPSTFNERQINTSILGGKGSMPEISGRTPLKISVILLNSKWSPYRAQTIENLVNCGFSSIVSIETSPQNYNLFDLSNRFPYVKFVFPLEQTSVGDLINIGMSEVSPANEYVLVLRDNIRITSDLLNANLAAKLVEKSPFCVTPRLLTKENNSFPILFSPFVKKSVLSVTASSAVSDRMPNLYPFDFVGLYNRDKFIRLGGFDYTITASYWQNLDLAFRAWLWGERINFSTTFSLSYNSDIDVEDMSANQSSNRFYLKNLVPRFSADHAMIPISAFFVYFPRSACGFLEAARQFKDARNWVKKNKYCFRRDALELVENWGKR